MRFYGMRYRDVLELPIRLFWFLSSQVDRIRAEEILDFMPALSTAMGGDHVKDVFEGFKQRVGQALVTETLKPVRSEIEAAKRKLAGLI